MTSNRVSDGPHEPHSHARECGPQLSRSQALELREPLAPTQPIDDHTAVALAETFRILGDTTRVRLLDALSRSERCVQDLAREVGSSESAVSHQLRLLRGMRIVRARRVGRQMFYALDDLHIVRLFAQGLEHVQEQRRGWPWPAQR